MPTNHRPQYILDRFFRANTGYELIESAYLTDAENATLGTLKDSPSCYGVLRPRSDGGTVKAVCHETAALWKSLLEPGLIPAWAREGNGEAANASVAQLVLDGVLSMGIGDSFASGAAASGVIYPRCRSAAGADGVLANLSLRALRYAQELEIEDPLTLAARLYHYGRIPLSPRWINRFPSAESIRKEVDCGREWQPLTEREGWLAFRCRVPAPPSAAGSKGYKLYLSPRPEHVPTAVNALARSAAEHGAHHFKIGNSAAGLLRADKIVAYFHDRSAASKAAEALAGSLRGCPAHGVPFTAELSGDGLLSWGVDPPSTGEVADWYRGESWRLHVAKRLAAAIVDARRSPAPDQEPYEFALERIRLDGIDPASWTPLEWARQIQ